VSRDCLGNRRKVNCPKRREPGLLRFMRKTNFTNPENKPITGIFSRRAKNSQAQQAASVSPEIHYTEKNKTLQGGTAMSTHIAAKNGDIAEAILLPGDPLRAKHIAENFLEKPVQYTAVRNILGYTGFYRGKRVSVQGTGMGIPSISIYANELFQDYGVQRAIRVGTAGALQPDMKIRDLVIALSASTDSGVNAVRFGGRNYAPTASFSLIKTAYDKAVSRGRHPLVGPIVSTDTFYSENPEDWKLWAKFGCLAVEMEAAELYTLAAKYRREALALLTISDSLVTGESSGAEDRQPSFPEMMEVALETAIS
jgi:purine-nucleoside phosphorylase